VGEFVRHLKPEFIDEIAEVIDDVESEDEIEIA
jgi:hypothetical protein